MRNKKLREEIQFFKTGQTNSKQPIQPKNSGSGTGHFESEYSEDVIASLEEALGDTLSDEFYPFSNLDTLTDEQKDRAVTAAAILNNLTKGHGTKFRLNVKDDNVLIEAIHALDVLLKDKEWLKRWGQLSASKSEKIFKLRKALLKKWNDG